MPKYSLGDKPPPPWHDAGSGPCNQDAPPSLQYIALRAAVLQALNDDTINVEFGVDAVRHMRHYMGNTGQDLPVNVQDFMTKSKLLKHNFDMELVEAQKFCRTLPLGVHQITSDECGVDTFETNHMFFAMGSYKFWGQGKASVNPRPNPDMRFCLLEFTFHFVDRYNWDANSDKETRILPGIKIKDSQMAQFQRECLAQDYDIHGQFKHQLVWDYRWR